MPQAKYLKAFIDNQQLDVKSVQELPVSISYKLEDSENFQTKQSSQLLNMVVPATTNNDRIANTFHNPGIEDLTPGQVYRNFRKGSVEANGYELMVGKALLTNARHDSKPISYEFDYYGNNADWILDLKDATLYDFLKHITFVFTKANIIASWAFDGTNENLPYVFAPVRYGQVLDNYNDAGNPIIDKNMIPEYMRPSLSIYWIIYWAFKSLGYKISSSFFNTSYFKRMVMPWTFGNFLYSDGTRLNNLDFLAKSTRTVSMLNTSFTGFWDLLVSNDSTNGGFDNNNSYQYDGAAFEMKWTYLNAFNYGPLESTHHINLAIDAVATANSDVELRVKWFVNGVHVVHGNDDGNGNLLVSLNAPAIGRRDFIGQVDDWFTALVNPGNVVSAKIYLHTFKSSFGIARIFASVDAFELDYFRVPLGGTIDFSAYSALKNYKFLDFLAGILDCFNISPQTDPVNKVVCLEPMHPYSTTNDLSVTTPGYFNGNILDWSKLQDIAKESELDLFSDSQKELIFKFKDDSSDGLLKVVQDRNVNLLGIGKFVLPDRFQQSDITVITNSVGLSFTLSGKQVENRFFSPTMHVELPQWKGLGTDPDASPQIVCLCPENVSNTSRDEAQNTFQPKIAWYKGIINNVGWVFDNDLQNSYPFMFAVNYQPGGEADPILSYSDERIGPDGAPVMGKGLLRRFFLQRLAIMRNGQYYTTFFELNNIHVTNWLHREHIVCRGQKWELVEIKDYKPLLEQTTECFMRKWEPVSLADSNNVYPASARVLDLGAPTGKFDIKYAPLKCLISDLHTTN